MTEARPVRVEGGLDPPGAAQEDAQEAAEVRQAACRTNVFELTERPRPARQRALSMQTAARVAGPQSACGFPWINA
ncbi:hypothetical protein [Kitasatospora aureofaciens]|uniref:hypothetical protein n=1 Tax=Kitasatospora aureofaciens TaxID=1894 RepID=UPI003F4D4802